MTVTDRYATDLHATDVHATDLHATDLRATRRDATGLADLAPVGLGELTETAALLTRTDRKYVVPAGDLPALLGRLRPHVRVLEIDGERSFAYESDYFDSLDLRCFRDTAHRRRRRFKVRTRRYTTGASFLEVKTAVARGTAKHRLPWAGERLDAEARSFVAATLADAGIGAMPALTPVLRTTYRRTTLHLPRDGARVTLDSDLEWISLLDGQRARVERLVVIETKTVSGPCAADRLLWASGHRPRALSKYATGQAALDPALPRNRWHRLLTDTSVAHALPSDAGAHARLPHS